MTNRETTMDNTQKRHPSLQPLSRDHGVGLLCAQHGHKAMRASKHDRLRLAEQIRTIGRRVCFSYLADEERVLLTLIGDAALAGAFQQHQDNVRKIIDELDRLDPVIDPGLGLMASVAAALETYVCKMGREFAFPCFRTNTWRMRLAKVVGAHSHNRVGKITYNTIASSVDFLGDANWFA